MREGGRTSTYSGCDGVVFGVVDGALVEVGVALHGVMSNRMNRNRAFEKVVILIRL